MNTKVIILDGGTLPSLNALLGQGYIIIHSCPMPGGTQPTCLVVLRKDS